MSLSNLSRLLVITGALFVSAACGDEAAPTAPEATIERASDDVHVATAAIGEGQPAQAEGHDAAMGDCGGDKHEAKAACDGDCGQGDCDCAKGAEGCDCAAHAAAEKGAGELEAAHADVFAGGEAKDGDCGCAGHEEGACGGADKADGT